MGSRLPKCNTLEKTEGTRLSSDILPVVPQHFVGAARGISLATSALEIRDRHRPEFLGDVVVHGVSFRQLVGNDEYLAAELKQRFQSGQYSLKNGKKREYRAQ